MEWFDIDKGKESGVFVSGGRQHGKTNLAKILADLYMNNGCVVKVFDNSQAWNRSNIPNKVTLRQDLRQIDFGYPFDQSTIFDISRLYIDLQRVFIQAIIGTDFRNLVDNPNPYWTIYFFEESQIILPSGSLRARYAQEAFRMISIGANYRCGYVLITQRPADVSTKAISRCHQLYIGRHWEVNDVNKLKRFLGWRKFDEARENLSTLNKGEFYYCGSEPVKIQTPLHRQIREPVEYVKPKTSFWRKLFGAW